MYTIPHGSKKNNARGIAGAPANSAYEKMQSSSPPAKLFDRKFVATALRNTLCCPKCRSEYSTNYDLRMGDAHVKSNRPFLLTCGHNMCENCIYQNHQNLVCSVCQNPIIIDKGNPPSTSLSCTAVQQQQRHHIQQRHENFNVRDFFYMNFFLIGALNHLRFYRRESSANNSLTISCHSPTPLSTASGKLALAPGVQAQPQAASVRCSECELQPAAGLCRQCKVYYCRICYDTIHMYGKALKRHSFVALGNGRNAGGRDLKVLRPGRCRQHGNITDRYCRTCKSVCCSTCFMTNHHGHRWTALGIENENMRGEIENILESVKMSRESLRKAQKVSSKSNAFLRQ
ncbi:uncharacterized protein LOC128855656 [Anastrepha ludens]|uniref:uncharacterized protein LOC128855656 n=1 Tax=Anastrepha ludens TaxID=28586 RepID=UPI0023B0B5C6|nr:uncharacterized protein LOC128855656 [Anastrepha ludens]